MTEPIVRHSKPALWIMTNAKLAALAHTLGITFKADAGTPTSKGEMIDAIMEKQNTEAMEGTALPAKPDGVTDDEWATILSMRAPVDAGLLRPNDAVVEAMKAPPGAILMTEAQMFAATNAPPVVLKDETPQPYNVYERAMAARGESFGLPGHACLDRVDGLYKYEDGSLVPFTSKELMAVAGPTDVIHSVVPTAKAEASKDLLGEEVHEAPGENESSVALKFLSEMSRVIQVLHRKVTVLEQDRDGWLKTVEHKVAALEAGIKQDTTLHGHIDNLGKIGAKIDDLAKIS